ncbi:hypothetical protein [Actinokineospora sp. HUAS TT18]|uniref:hypothetical protein n=1 Tax=Actinokineospora sp. HUAS TT18 TaxID=3447451 RepID=UPI003F524794
MADDESALDLAQIEERQPRAVEVAPRPWTGQLESRFAAGGCSMIRVDETADHDHEIYLDVRLRDESWGSPTAELDAVVDFLAHAPADIQSLLDEVRRLRARS